MYTSLPLPETTGSNRTPCYGKTELFFSHPAERPQQRERREASAKALCAMCDVRIQCLELAQEREEYGIWGGTNEDERMRRRIPVPRAGLSRSAKKELSNRNKLL